MNKLIIITLLLTLSGHINAATQQEIDELCPLSGDCGLSEAQRAQQIDYMKKVPAEYADKTREWLKNYDAMKAEDMNREAQEDRDREERNRLQAARDAERRDKEARAAKEQRRLAAEAANQASINYKASFDTQATLPRVFDKPYNQCVNNANDNIEAMVLISSSYGNTPPKAEIEETRKMFTSNCQCKYGMMAQQGFLLGHDNRKMADDMVRVEKFLAEVFQTQLDPSMVNEIVEDIRKRELQDQLTYRNGLTAQSSAIMFCTMNGESG